MKPHGIMFHHFHGGLHPAGQGSITSEDLENLLKWLRRRHRLLNASDFYDAALAGNLSERDICLTFDDSLLSQYELAAPVLADEDVTAFYFVYSSAFTDNPDMLEVFRYFRSTQYEDFDGFCEDFMTQAELMFGHKVRTGLVGFKPEMYLKEYSFYSDNDRLFRYVRDHVLTSIEYESAMRELMEKRDFRVDEALNVLFMKPSHLVSLRDGGNIVGLHSHSHPLNMDALAEPEQRYEYQTNYSFLSGVLGEPTTSMSHPCGRYSGKTLQILIDLGIRLGFRSNMKLPPDAQLLEIPRDDHSVVFKRMQS